MAADRNRQLLGGDAAPVIPYSHEADAAALDVDLDPACARVEAILDQLLDDRGRALDDFAGCDLIDQLAGQDSDGHDRAVYSSGARHKTLLLPGQDSLIAGDEIVELLRLFGEERARGRMLAEVAADAVENGMRDLELTTVAAEAALFGRIGNIVRLDQHRGNVR